MLINDVVTIETVDMSDIADQWLAEEFEQNTTLLENHEDWSAVASITNLIIGDQPVIGQPYVPLLLQFIPGSKKVFAGSPQKLLTLKNILTDAGFTQYEFNDSGKLVKYPVDQYMSSALRKTYIFDKLSTADMIVNSFIPMQMKDWKVVDRRGAA
jgi:hypothetical protein